LTRREISAKLFLVRTPPTSNKSTYEAPAVVMHGTVADITGGIGPGVIADHSFPNGALSVSLTISL